MKRKSKKEKIETRVETINHLEQIGIRIQVDAGINKQLIALLMLLREKLVEKVEIVFDNFTVRLTLSDKIGNSTCSVVDMEKHIFEGIISINMLEYWIRFLLEFYRDGGHSVNHIDLEFHCSDHTDFLLYVGLTFGY